MKALLLCLLLATSVTYAQEVIGVIVISVCGKPALIEFVLTDKIQYLRSDAPEFAQMLANLKALHGGPVAYIEAQPGCSKT